ncbi:ATP-dependent DNA helicase [Paenibacillus harenae]|uniref:ATP-dependent DNA helicase n=1 Tax=Paenibacillus harenae TaxID=306543 RepID=UPI00278D11A0|nr:ATP-dependent DNA helicase [Paenibacillus harenae]MDQ0061867.1 Rad3-related DNA helicase [Paenibacillus harenae]
MSDKPSTIAISVRHLVEYAYLSGSIDVKLNAVDSMHEGTKAHQRIQQQYGELDRKEVYLKADIEAEGLLFAVDGRCDGLLATEPAITIDEIKSTSGDLDHITEHSYPVHWAQAMFYAYMYAKDEGLPQMRVQLTYVHTQSDRLQQFDRVVSFEELERFVAEVVRLYVPYAALRLRHAAERDASIEALAFPFGAYRAGQRKLAGAVYKSIDEGVRLFARAPTGIGKTISTTFPAVKAIGSGLLQRFYYLTARTTTKKAAEDALLLMDAKGLRMHAVTLTAKDKICFQDEVRCEKEHCPYAEGYYDRINGAVLDILANETVMTRPVIERYAEKHRVCPFEFSLDVAYAADAVICDYNYIFDPRISFKRQYNEQKKRTALLVDEAHNLVDRARDMYSAELAKSAFLALQRELKGTDSAGYKAAKAVNDYFIALRKQNEDSPQLVEKQLPTDLVELAESFAAAAEPLLASGQGVSELLLDTYFAVQSFIRVAKHYDERYVTLTERTNNELRVKLFCLDPSQMLQLMGKGYRSHIYFSATLSPVSYYMDMLGAGEKDYTLAVASPFAKEQLEVVVKAVSTRYQDRDDSYGPIARQLAQLVAERPGNYFVFFPSYAYMNAVHKTYLESWATSEGEGASKTDVLLQQPDMSEEQRDQFLASFQAGNENSLIGFAVMGGVFSEGVDLEGDRLVGVVVVGVGLPQLGLERNMIRDYFNEQGKSGYDYAYVFPGMNKVLQAGGRLIRSETDRGTLMLIDDRYLQPHYNRLLPEEWRC